MRDMADFATVDAPNLPTTDSREAEHHLLSSSDRCPRAVLRKPQSRCDPVGRNVCSRLSGVEQQGELIHRGDPVIVLLDAPTYHVKVYALQFPTNGANTTLANEVTIHRSNWQYLVT